MLVDTNQSANTTKYSTNQIPEAPLDQSLVLWFCFKLIIVLLGVVGNILVCNAMRKRLARQDIKRWNVNVFIFSLAVADLGVLLFVFPLSTVMQFMPQRWPFGEVICFVLYPFGDTFYGSSIWSIAAIAIDRCWVTSRMQSRPNKTTSQKRAKRNACIIVAIVWLSSFLVVALPLHIAMEYKSDKKGTTCNIDVERNTQFMKTYSMVILVFCYLLPLAIISWSYTRIWKKVQQSSRFHRSMSTAEGSPITQKHNSRMDHESEMLKQNARVKRMLTPLVIAFAITMFPISLFRMLLFFWPGFATTRGRFLYPHFAEVFVVANSSINPIIYSIVNKQIRREMNVLGCFKRTPGNYKQESLALSVRFKHEKDTSSSLVSHWPPAESLRETNL